MGNIKELIALGLMAALATGLIVRLDLTTNFVHAMFTDFNSLAKTISGQLGTGSVSTASRGV